MKPYTLSIALMLLLSCGSYYGIAQGSVYYAKGIYNLYKITDTLKTDHASVTLQVLWMDSIIEVRQTISLRYNLESERKWRHDSTYLPAASDTTRYFELRKNAAQNCHSYSLEKFFQYHKFSNQLFYGRTVLTENHYMDDILATAFKRINARSTRPRKNLKEPFTKGSLIIFRNKWGTPIHSVFYDGEFQTKNGVFKAKAEKSIQSIFKTYWDTTTIEEYGLDIAKVNRYENRQLLN